MIPQPVKDAFDKQGTHELFAANSYYALGLWCEHNDYSGYAKFFKQQAEEEMQHAAKFFDHELERGELPEVGTVPAPKSDYTSLIEVAKAALELEQANTKGITEVYELALDAKDYPSQPMLQWFIAEQMEEEAWAETMVTKTMRATDAGALFYLDRNIIEELGISESETEST
ncbi:ferritin [Coraliomargarita akajimensis]|uniref:Ferritin n=1 Tax=Coraliomargarita akajimensis (strain DSM 45221 / IAM 15411 / JCM 23193 / KCTC 12865 / 04OKA010-24) TaxID=583355 RepID=D5EQN2_CORAD|nr:ferritin [Coraliomargarita akajimensis]ADE55846.1 Ferritin Dps family protein [Coraliomargarita akajimensis DSM 45221]